MFDKRKLAFLGVGFKGHPRGRAIAEIDACLILKVLTKEFHKTTTFICLFLHDAHFLDDTHVPDRAKGIVNSLTILHKCDEMWVRDVDLTLASGISHHSALFGEIEKAMKWGKRIVVFQEAPTRILRTPTSRVRAELKKIQELQKEMKE